MKMTLNEMINAEIKELVGVDRQLGKALGTAYSVKKDFESKLFDILDERFPYVDPVHVYDLLDKWY